MDIIAMQAANKVLKKLNTEYNGMDEHVTATAGQTTFDLPKEYSPGSHTLEVHVDGVLAILGVDYTETDNDTITFAEPRDLGQIVTFRTRVAGIPKYDVINPAYDDTQVKDDISALQTSVSNLETAVDDAVTSVNNTNSRISSAETAIQDIKSALDADGDGSIIDTIADIKTQWEAADGDIQVLIGNKANQTDLENLDLRVDSAEDAISVFSTEMTTARNGKASLTEELTAIKNSIPTAYDDTDLAGRVSSVEQNIVDIAEDLGAVATEIANAKGGSGTLSQKLEDIQNSIPAAYDDSALDNRVDVLENKTLSEFTVADTATGWLYKLKITNGVIVADLVKKLLSVMLTRVGSGTVYKGDTVNYTASATYEDTTDATADTVFTYGVDNNTLAEIDAVTGALLAKEEGVIAITLTGVNKGITKQATINVTIYLTDSQTVEKVKSALTLGDLSNVTDNLVLPSEDSGAAISWASDNEAVIATDGTVVRPVNGTGNVDVTLTATITKGVVTDTKVFTATVAELPA